MLAIQLDERTKKVLLVLIALFIIVLLVFGTIYYFVERYMKQESKKMDDYMYDLIKYKIVKNPKEFKEALDYQEIRMYFNGTKWPLRIIFIVTGIFLVITMLSFDKNFVGLFTEFFKLFPILSWKTLGMVNAELPETMQIPGPSWLPASIFPTVTSKNPDFSSALLYCSSIYYILIIISFFFLTRAILGHFGRYLRGLKMKDQIFLKSLDNIDIGSLDDLTAANKSQNNTEKETE